MPGPTKRRPLARGRAPTSAAISVDFPDAVRADDREAVAVSKLEVDRPEPEAVPLDDRLLEAGDDLAGSPRPERELEAPGRPRLLHLLEPLEPLVGGAHLGHQRVCSPPVRHLPGGPRLALAPSQQRLEPLTLTDVAFVCSLVAEPAGLAEPLVLGPAPGELADPPRLGLELHDPLDRLLEKRPVVGDEDERARRRGHEALQQLEAVEIEVVRRLVEEQHVEAGEKDRSQLGARRLASRESPERPVEPVEPDPGRSLAGACVEVVGAEREEALEGVGVLLRGLGLVGEARRQRVQLDRGGIHARAPFEVCEERLVGPCVDLLGEMADGQRRRTALEHALVGLVQPGEQAQERRLSAPVGPDHADPSSRADEQRRAVENRLGAVALRDVRRGKGAAAVAAWVLLIDGTPLVGRKRGCVDQRTRIERARGSSRTIAIVARCDGSPQEENVESAPRQAPRNPQARSPAGQRVPGLPSAQAAASDVPDLQDLPRTRSRATACAGPVESARSQSIERKRGHMAASRDEVYERVREVLAERLSVEEADITEEANFQEDLGADSLDLVEMIMELEDQFGIKIPDEDAQKIQTVGQAVEYVTSHQ